MRRKFLCMGALALALVLGASPGVEAASITGSITFGGGFTPTGGTGLADATGVDITGDAAVISCAFTSSCEGTYSVVTGLVGATYHDFTFDPLGGGTTPLWSFSFGGVDYSFNLESVTIVDQSATALVLKGTGTLFATGLDPTAAKWSFSGDTSGALLAFSATNSVPEPASTLLLGLSLLGGSYAMRRRARATR